MEAIFWTYRKQVYPPGTAKKHKKKDKIALELSSVMVRECWTLFKSIWTMRNTILRSKYSIGARTLSVWGQLINYAWVKD